MANGIFEGFVLTEKGEALKAKVEAGLCGLNITEVQYGSGSAVDTTVETLRTYEALIAQETSSLVHSYNISDDEPNKATIRSILTNSGLAEGFELFEIGLAADDPDEGSILYCYDNSGITQNMVIPPEGSGSLIKQIIDIPIITTSPDRINIIEGDLSAEMATLMDLREHTDDAASHFSAAERTKLADIDEGANNYSHPSSHPATMITEDSDHRFMTDAERSKLSGIAAGANAYSHPSSHPASMIVEDSNHRFMTDTERNKLSGISAGANAYSHPSSHPATMITEDSDHRFMTDTERSKLSGIASGANNYSHPSSHPATMITEDSSHRFMTDTERNKLSGIDAGANAYSHPSSHPATMITEDSSHRFVTDTEKSTWNGKADAHSHPYLGSNSQAVDSAKLEGQTLAQVKSHSHTADDIAETSSNKIMTSAERTKLSGVAAGANAYSHPSSHPATMITEDSSHRFITDTERNKLTGIAAGANAYSHPSTHPASMITEDSSHRFMTDTERNKLSGIASGANAYSHPSTHPASMITEDSSHRFMTDAERNKLQDIEVGPWQTFTLINGWSHITNREFKYRTILLDGSKHLQFTGGIKNTSGASPVNLQLIADGTIPSDYRPNYNTSIPISSYEYSAELSIQSDGSINFYGNTSRVNYSWYIAGIAGIDS